RLVRPLALGLQPQMGSALFKRHLKRPAHDDPLQDLLRRRLEIGTEERFHAQLALRVRHQHVADRYGGQPGSIPPGSAREDPQLFALATVPRDFHGLPGGIAARCPALQAPLALALGGFGTPFALGLRSWGVIQRRIPAPRPRSRHRRPRPAAAPAASDAPVSSSAAPNPRWFYAVVCCTFVWASRVRSKRATPTP